MQGMLVTFVRAALLDGCTFRSRSNYLNFKDFKAQFCFLFIVVFSVSFFALCVISSVFVNSVGRIMPKARKTASAATPRQASRARRQGKILVLLQGPAHADRGLQWLQRLHRCRCQHTPLDGLPLVQGEVAPPEAQIFGESWC